MFHDFEWNVNCLELMLENQYVQMNFPQYCNWTVNCPIIAHRHSRTISKNQWTNRAQNEITKHWVLFLILTTKCGYFPQPTNWRKFISLTFCWRDNKFVNWAKIKTQNKLMLINSWNKQKTTFNSFILWVIKYLNLWSFNW